MKHDVTPKYFELGLRVPDGYMHCDGCRKAVHTSMFHKKQLDMKYPWCKQCLQDNRPRYNTLMKAREEESSHEQN